MTPKSLRTLFPVLPMIHIVDIGASPIDGDPPYKNLLDQKVAKVLGFEPNPEQFRHLTQTQFQTYRPEAVGTGEPGFLRICRAPGMTSMLEPDLDVLKHFHGFVEWAEVLGRIPMETVRLDSILEARHTDFLKIDAQGSELSILQNGTMCLQSAVVVQVEVNFVPFYVNQPLFAEIDTFLRSANFYLHKFTPIVSRIFKPMSRRGDPFAGMSQVLWADAIYVRKFPLFLRLSKRDLLVIALLAHDVYGSIDLCTLALHTIDPSMAKSYVEWVRS